MCTYVNGKLSCTIKTPELSKDGQHALKRRLALFWAADEYDCDAVYLRSLCVHNVALDAELKELSGGDCVAFVRGFAERVGLRRSAVPSVLAVVRAPLLPSGSDSTQPRRRPAGPLLLFISSCF